MEEIRLTQFSHGSGCGCKIAPAVLEQIIGAQLTKPDQSKLLVGNDSGDDAAVYDLGDERCLISTTDFFTPIVDDPYHFGRIAAANALSDVYAMGGKPAFALAVLGWPVSKLPVELAAQVLEGARSTCTEAGIVIAGGHSIDIPEPVFGLVVNGFCEKKHLKKNNSAKAGDVLYLTKALGVGILATAQKRGLLQDEHHKILVEQLCRLNKEGETFGKKEEVHAMTDVTGFGFIGHLLEMCKGSGLKSEINYKNIPVLNEARSYSANFIYPDNTMRNWSSYQHEVEGISGESLLMLCDPQTNGGLLLAVDAAAAEAFEKEFHLQKIGVLSAHNQGKRIVLV